MRDFFNVIFLLLLKGLPFVLAHAEVVSIGGFNYKKDGLY